MPPPDEKNQPSVAERNAVIELIDEQMLTAGSGEAYRKKLLAPEYGNWVNHEKLFSGEIKTPPSPRPTVAIQSGDFCTQRFWQSEESLQLRDFRTRDS